MSNIKQYNIFLIISSFTKLLIETFLPLVIYNIGFSFIHIEIFYLFTFLTIFVFIFPISKLGLKIGFNKLMIISSFLFSFTYIFINYLNKNIYFLLFISIINGLYLISYWLGRHIYGIKIIKNKNVTNNVSLYTIFSIIGSIPAPFIGSYLLKKIGYFSLSIISLILSLISVIPLFFIKENKNERKLNLKLILKRYPKKNYLIYFLCQFKFFLILFFPLYVFINVDKNFKFIGMLTVFQNLASVIYVYVFSKLMEKHKKNYFNLTIFLLDFIFLIHIFIKNKTILMFIIFLEGILNASFDTILLRETYSFKNNYNYISYITFVELMYSFYRVIILGSFIIFKLKLKLILYICIFLFIFSSFFKYIEGKNGYS